MLAALAGGCGGEMTHHAAASGDGDAGQAEQTTDAGGVGVADSGGGVGDAAVVDAESEGGEGDATVIDAAIFDAAGLDTALGDALPADAASILAALDTSDDTIDQATGADLLNLAAAIGFARGYAICTCVPPGFQGEALEQCAVGESLFSALYDPVRARCILEESRDVPGFDAYLQCYTKLARDVGRGYANCMDAMIGPDPYGDPTTCLQDSSAPPGFGLLFDGCQSAFSCSDGTFTSSGRCDLKVDCSDGADEHGCGDFICGDVLVDAGDVCSPGVCSLDVTPPICNGDSNYFQCGDGTQVYVYDVCNGTQDCANGRDEEYCY